MRLVLFIDYTNLPIYQFTNLPISPSRMQFWDVPAFEKLEYEQQLRDACNKVGASFYGYEVTPAFRYIVCASIEQMNYIAVMVPWIKYFHTSIIRNKECVLVETDKQ